MRHAYSRPGDVDDVLRMTEIAPEHGFAALQLKQNQFVAWIGEPNAFRERFDVSRIMGLIVYGSDESRVRESHGFASTLGIAHVTWVPDWKKDGSRLVSHLPQLERLGAEANLRGVAVSVHNHAGTLIETSADLRMLCAEMDPTLVGITFDTAHLRLAGESELGSVIRDVASHLRLVHIKDVRARVFCSLGQGEVVFEDVFEALRDVAYDGWCVVDDETDGTSITDAIPLAASFLNLYC